MLSGRGNEETLKILKKNLGPLLKKINSLQRESWLRDLPIFINVSSMDMVVEVFLESWKVYLITWMALIVFMASWTV